MPPIDQLKEEVERSWPAEPATKLCTLIIDCIASFSPQQSRMFTFGNLCRMVGKSAPDNDLLTALNILVSSRVQALDARALFVDERQSEYEVDLEEINAARESGMLVHPRSGEMISNYQAYVVPFFVPSAKFLGMTDAKHG
jgi:hypothetical protein